MPHQHSTVFKTARRPFGATFHNWRIVLESNQFNQTVVRFSKPLRYHPAHYPNLVPTERLELSRFRNGF